MSDAQIDQPEVEPEVEVAPKLRPQIAQVSVADISSALALGWADFRAAPLFGLFFGGIFSLIGIVIFLQLAVLDSSMWVLPLAAGFPLVGPFAAVGLYEVSRRRERGLPLEWAQILTVVGAQRRSQIPSAAFVVLFFYLIWVYLAHLVFALFFGLKPLTNVMTSFDILMTVDGVLMLLIGSLVGGALAALLFAVTVISVPLLLEKDIDVVSAMILSVQTVAQSPGPMFGWAILIAVATVGGMIPLFLGTLVVFPVIAHSSWHLYRHAIRYEEAAQG